MVCVIVRNIADRKSGGVFMVLLVQLKSVFILSVMLVWLTCQTPAVGGLIVCLCVRRHVAHIARRMMNG